MAGLQQHVKNFLLFTRSNYSRGSPSFCYFIPYMTYIWWGLAIRLERHYRQRDWYFRRCFITAFLWGGRCYSLSRAAYAERLIKLKPLPRYYICHADEQPYLTEKHRRQDECAPRFTISASYSSPLVDDFRRRRAGGTSPFCMLALMSDSRYLFDTCIRVRRDVRLWGDKAKFYCYAPSARKLKNFRYNMAFERCRHSDYRNYKIKMSLSSSASIHHQWAHGEQEVNEGQMCSRVEFQ